MLEDETRKKKVTDALAVLEVAVRNRAALSLYDIHKVAEDFCAGFLNILDGCKLRNLNTGHKNNSAIDLGDVKKKLAYQVTSVNDKKKVQDTLDKFVKDSWHKKYNHVRVLMLTPPKRAYKGLKLNAKLVRFSPTTDIIGLSKLGELASNSGKKLEPLAEFVEQQMPLLTAYLAEAKLTDADALAVYRKKFDRDALHHPLHREGPMPNFEKALVDLTTLLEDGKIDSKVVAKGRGDFDDKLLVSALRDLHVSLSKLKGLFNQHVNTGEIDPKGRGYDFRHPDTPRKFNEYKQAVIDSLNKALKRGGLPPIRGVDS